ncbi:spore maturation protein [Alicyclobacillus macrosporangiidus]|uniref:Spore maturation protein B n=1 Tax=Alicyclobacillus macrosporangiidus TaxID=392015 RepID=A0A1I7KM46_9BACL|nr:nucleoside recognition domain-containing protein [Alicyclobacillus macrosporangiidus]SFU98481.1 spore maturation protein B [Alicyclobacillus macrosporangiidus]
MQQVLSTVSAWLLPVLVAAVLVAGYARRVPIYNAFVEGAKAGFGTSIRLIPHLVAMMVAVQVFSASGAMDLVVRALAPAAHWLHLPPQVVPMALLRPISSTGSLAFLKDIFQNPRFGPDSWVGQLASTLQAASDTTLYVITVYFGSVGIKNIRYALKVGLLADVASVVGSVIAVRILLGPMPGS